MNQIKNKNTRAIILLVFTMLVWGSSYSITKSVVTILPPATFAVSRFMIALLCLLPFYLSGRKNKPSQHFDTGDFWWLFLMGLTGIAGYYIFFNYSLMFTSASNGALIQGFIPVCIALFGAVFLKEKLTGLQMTGIGLCFIGVVLVGVIAASNSNDASSLKGNLFMVISVLCWTTYTLVSRKLNHLNPFTITFLSGCIGAALLIPVSIYELINLKTPVEIGVNGWLALVYLGAVSSGICYVLYNKAIELLPVAMVGTFLNLDILIGVSIAVIFLHEEIDIFKIAGGLLILLGLTLSSRKKN